MIVRSGRNTVSLSFGEEGPKPCPSISIVVNEAADNPYRWLLTVWTRYPESLSVLGQVLTQPPSITTVGNRVVALAYAPGAVGWMVEATPQPIGEAPRGGAVADIYLSYSPCCGALHRPGVEAVEPLGVGEPIFGVVTGQQQLFAAGATLIIGANRFRRRLSLANRIVGGNGGDIAIGPTIAVALASGRLLKNGDAFETSWRGAVYGIGTAAGPAPFDGVTWWAENG